MLCATGNLQAPPAYIGYWVDLTLTERLCKSIGASNV